MNTQVLGYWEDESGYTDVIYPIHTKGNVDINEIKVGDIHYEYEYGILCKSTVQTKPTYNDENGVWEWTSKGCESGKIINYAQNPNYSHYGLNLYDYPAYSSKADRDAWRDSNAETSDNQNNPVSPRLPKNN